ncbi:MAG: AI-2E family transporter [Burkholderiaceae bacterium]
MTTASIPPAADDAPPPARPPDRAAVLAESRRRRAADDVQTDAVMASTPAPAPASLAPDEEEPSTTVMTAAPTNVRNVSLVVIAVLAGVYVLHWASAVFIPLLLGVMFSYALTPAVSRMCALGLPRTAAAALLLIGILGGLGGMGYALADDAVALVERMPETAHKLRRAIEERQRTSREGTIDKVQKAATELELAAQAGAGAAAATPPRGVTKVVIEKPAFDVKDYLMQSGGALAAGAGQAVVVIFVTFFLLASGDTFRRKMVKIAGPTFGQKKITLQALDEIDHQIQRYLIVNVFTSAVVGLATWLAFWWIGVTNPGVWGVATFILNFVPYIGGILVTVAAAVIGFTQFGSLQMGLVIGGVAMLINSIEGYILTPWLTGKASRMNPVAVFVGVLAWGWIWGAWGLLLGVPILMVVKTVCDRVDDLKPVGELLGD